MYEEEKAFFEAVAKKEESSVEKWLTALHCPVIRLEGTYMVEESVQYILQKLPNR